VNNAIEAPPFRVEWSHAEDTFDSDEFPKVVFRDQVSEADVCSECGASMSGSDGS